MNMTPEEKSLLIKDLCARLPYGVICFKEITNCMPSNSVLLEEDIYSFRTGEPTVADYGQYDYYKTIILELKPYLRPLSSMTEEEKRELVSCINKEAKRLQERLKCGDCGIEQGKYHFNSDYELDFCLSHHFDYRGLIEKGLALEAPKGMYND